LEKLNSLWRPETTGFPDISLPIYQRSIGHFIREGERLEYNPAGRNFVELYWCVRGEGEVVVDGDTCRFAEDDFFFYLPHEPHSLRGVGVQWEYRWLTFDGPGAKDFMLSYNFPRKVFHAGKCPVKLFQEQEDLLREMSQYAWREMVAIICRILAKAGGMADEKSIKGSLLRDAIRICRDGFQNPELNVNSLADQLGVCRSSLLKAFREKMNMAPSDYIMKLRLQSATSLLMNRHFTLKEIAFQSGFTDSAYFSRMIRNKFGMPPSELRESWKDA